METNIQKWGNSLGVRLPKQIAQNQSLHEGSRVVVTEAATGIAIEVVKNKKCNSLTYMLADITPENMPGRLIGVIRLVMRYGKTSIYPV